MDYEEKPKRKLKNSEKPLLFLIIGLLAGAILTAGGIAAFLFIKPSEAVTFNPSPVAQFAMPTEPPVAYYADSQALLIQPTVIASRINSVALAPDGKYLAATAWEDAQAVLYWQEMGSSTNFFTSQNIQGHLINTDVESQLSFSPDSQRLLVASTNQVQLYAVGSTWSEQALQIWEGYSTAAINPQNSQIALGATHGGMLQIVDSQTYALINQVLFEGQIIELLYSPDGQQLAVGLYENSFSFTVRIFDVTSLTVLADYTVAGLLDLAYHPSGAYLAVAADLSTVVLDTTSTGRSDYYFPAMGRVRTVSFSPDGEWLAIGGGESSGGYIGSVQLVHWDNTAGIIQPDPNYYTPVLLGNHAHDVTDSTFTPEGYLLTAGFDGSIRLWDVENLKEISRLQL